MSTKVSFATYLGEGATSDSKLIIDAIIFTEETYLQFATPFGGQKIEQASAGSVKFNVRMSQWNWCADDCASSNGVGDAIRLTVKMTNQIVSSVPAGNSSNASCDGGCSNGAVQHLGGVFVSILNIYSVENADGTVTDYSMPTQPSLTLSPEPGQENGASQRVSTLVLEFPRPGPMTLWSMTPCWAIRTLQRPTRATQRATRWASQPQKVIFLATLSQQPQQPQFSLSKAQSFNPLWLKRKARSYLTPM